MKDKKGSTNQNQGQVKIEFLIFWVECSRRNHESALLISHWCRCIIENHLLGMKLHFLQNPETMPALICPQIHLNVKRMHHQDIYWIYLLLSFLRKRSTEGQPKRITGGWKSSALIGWHGNTDFFVLLQREKEARNSGYHWHDDRLETHTRTHTHETGARLSHIKIQGRINNHPQWRAAQRRLHSLS